MTYLREETVQPDVHHKYYNKTQWHSVTVDGQNKGTNNHLRMRMSYPHKKWSTDHGHF